jgi:ribosome-associated heat shock protein Hsp15
MRIDKLLWFLRFARTRSIAQTLAEDGHLRLNGRRVDRSHQKIVPGDVLTLPLAQAVQVVEILMLPARRGPPSEAQACYRVLDGGRALPLAAGAKNTAAEGDLQL